MPQQGTGRGLLHALESGATSGSVMTPECGFDLCGICRHVAEHLGADSVGIGRVSDGHVKYVSGYGFDWRRVPPIPLGESLLGNVVASGRILASPDLRSDPRCTTAGVAREMGIAAFVAHPLFWGGERGVTAVHHNEPREISSTDIKNLELVTSILVTLLGGMCAVEGCDLRKGRAMIPLPGKLKCVVSSPPTRAAYEKALRVAKSDLPVLILGETGTGKEQLAQYIHNQSDRGGDLVAVNCAAIPVGLFESELFGHAKGAFTGAVRDKDGHFLAAGMGSIFLDEVGDLHPLNQAKLLRALETKHITRLGEARTRALHARIIAATNRTVGLGAATAFRYDLFHRLARVTIELKPLRERREDLLKLIDLFLTQAQSGVSLRACYYGMQTVPPRSVRSPGTHIAQSQFGPNVDRWTLGRSGGVCTGGSNERVDVDRALSENSPSRRGRLSGSRGAEEVKQESSRHKRKES